jgi:hypothetical protein
MAADLSGLAGYTAKALPAGMNSWQGQKQTELSQVTDTNVSSAAVYCASATDGSKVLTATSRAISSSADTQLRATQIIYKAHRTCTTVLGRPNLKLGQRWQGNFCTNIIINSRWHAYSCKP